MSLPQARAPEPAEAGARMVGGHRYLAGARSGWPIYAVAGATFLAILLLAWLTALTFPYPWNDEARFFLPS